MKRVVYISGVILLTLGTQSMAEGLDDLGEIKLVDESAKSNLFQREKIVGCTDFLEKKELSCAKEPKEAILSKLPSSQQLAETNLENKEEREDVKDQLSKILTELNTLKKEKQVNVATIKKLKGIINLLSNKNPKGDNEKMTIEKITTVKKEIKKIKPKKNKSYTATIIRKEIKEISRTDTEVIVEVQKNESLSTYAQAYYNDNRKYYKIYKANKDKIPESMVIIIGDRLSIPLN